SGNPSVSCVGWSCDWSQLAAVPATKRDDALGAGPRTASLLLPHCAHESTQARAAVYLTTLASVNRLGAREAMPPCRVKREFRCAPIPLRVGRESLFSCQASIGEPALGASCD